ncbi:energy transducer TonB [Acidithiobacillus thiooxidans]|uniref:energy transducer TonB family protein n=1 Tax=Acidithiobacillus TaxID=119977 RepID=UPI00026253DB|nr:MULTISPECIES: energy transducer TonB [Acidithiobacillus]MBE7567146.1 energy transducer TonB [Acidithiobacillus sp. HP-11]MBU2752585.1 energy transducer TonB [Acidithiobacillus thiooxidans]MBU2792288.1 energy transducer TonB [Acidithiobacillus thiooxidans]MBU2810959.1 energy transducer TonB [Acidithiobacillus thiooxidans]
MAGVKASSTPPGRNVRQRKSESLLEDGLFRLRWYGAVGIIAIGRIFRLRASDMDQLFPWLLFSLFVNLLVWMYLLLGLAAPLAKRNPVTSLVEISLTPTFHQPRISAPIDPRVSRPQADVDAVTHKAMPAVSSAERQAAYNFYLKNWEGRIMALAQKKLFAPGHGPLPQGRVVVAVTIAPNGHLLEISMLQGSRNVALVEAVETLIRAASPFAALPALWQSPPTPLRIVRTWSFE